MPSKSISLGLLVFLIILAVGCGPRRTLVGHLGLAENSLFTDDGRLFITGQNIWEIKQEGRSHKAVSLTDDPGCFFSGIVQFNNHLFVICYRDKSGDAWLMKAELTESPKFEKAYQLTDMTLANGMAVDDRGHLYIADTTFLKHQGKIIRLTLTASAVPEVIESSETVWLSPAQGAQSPNGITIVDNKLYFTNMQICTPPKILNSIKRVDIKGDRPGSVETVFSRIALKNTSMLDDLTSIDIQGQTYLMVADYLNGSILTIKSDETNQIIPVYETKANKFAGPTSCIVGRGGLGFNEKDLLVTEGGIVLIDPKTNFGNRLSMVKFRPENYISEN